MKIIMPILAAGHIKVKIGGKFCREIKLGALPY